MTHAARILADSISPDGVRLTTLEVTFPRIVLAEFNTHRMLSRNSASSRAIPVEKMIRMVEEHPYVPTHWGKNQKGMQANEELSEEDQVRAFLDWNAAKLQAIKFAKKLLDIGVHKQITNRLLEPFMWHTVIVSATEWSNFFHLRRHKDAHPEIKLAADLMFEAMEKSEPRAIGYDGWHTPLLFLNETLVDDNALTKENALKVSVARCARVSYLTHDGKRDPQADIDMAENKLGMHMSPWEHVARPATWDDCKWGLSHWNDSDELTNEPPLPPQVFFGNLRGWVSCRKLIPNEQDVLGEKS